MKGRTSFSYWRLFCVVCLRVRATCRFCSFLGLRWCRRRCRSGSVYGNLNGFWPRGLSHMLHHCPTCSNHQIDGVLKHGANSFDPLVLLDSLSKQYLSIGPRSPAQTRQVPAVLLKWYPALPKLLNFHHRNHAGVGRPCARDQTRRELNPLLFHRLCHHQARTLGRRRWW